MRCLKETDLQTDAGYRRLSGEKDDEVKGYGMRGMNLLRNGTPVGKATGNRRDGHADGVTEVSGSRVCHLLDSGCKSHRLQVRSSYGAETLAAAHGIEDAYPTIVTLHELNNNKKLTPAELKNVREHGGLQFNNVLTTDAESVFKSLSSRDLKVPTEKTLLGHVSWCRELLTNKILHGIRWCDTRDMTADGHTKGVISRDGLLAVMKGAYGFIHSVKLHKPMNTQH